MLMYVFCCVLCFVVSSLSVVDRTEVYRTDPLRSTVLTGSTGIWVSLCGQRVSDRIRWGRYDFSLTDSLTRYGRPEDRGEGKRGKGGCRRSRGSWRKNGEGGPWATQTELVVY